MWIRSRFKTDSEDYRPVKWPPVGPYWCSGSDSEDNWILIAYTKTEKQVKEFWPEATDIDSTREKEITFTSRFAEPDWWKVLKE